jgi:hypothetical protein
MSGPGGQRTKQCYNVDARICDGLDVKDNFGAPRVQEASEAFGREPPHDLKAMVGNSTRACCLQTAVRPSTGS